MCSIAHIDGIIHFILIKTNVMKQIKTISVILLAIVLCACNKNQAPNAEFGSPTDVDIMLVNTQISPSRAPSGKEDGTADESKISWLEFYVFDQTGNTLDPEVGRVDDVTPGNGYLKLTTSELTNKLRVSAGTNKKFIVVANSSIGAPAAGYNTYESLKAKLSAETFTATESGSDHNSRSTPADGFEISGYTSATIAAAQSNNKVYITIMRLVSKINAPTLVANIPVELTNQEQINEIWGEGTTVTTSTPITFEFNGYAVVNGVTKSSVSFVGNASGNYLDPVGSAWDTWSAKTYLNSSFNADGSYKNNYSGAFEGNWFLDATEANNSHRVYVYENKPTSVTINGVVGYKPETVYSYIIKGTLKAASETDAVRYWRVDLTKTDLFHIMRNCVYHVTINKISTPGYNTPKNAETTPGIIPDPSQTASDFVITVAQWDVNTYTTEM